MEYIAKLVGAKLDSKRTAILPLAVEPKKNAHPDEEGNVFRICWWGTWIPLHGLDNVINAIKLLSEKNVKLELFGVPGANGDPYIKMITEMKLSKYITVHTDKSFGNGLLEEYLSKKCDLALGIFGNSQKSKNVIVNKIVDAFAMALPVLTMEAPVLREFIDTENELFVCQNDPSSMADVVRNIINNPEERIRRSKLGHKRYLETFTSDHYAQNVLSIIDNVITEKQSMII